LKNFKKHIAAAVAFALVGLVATPIAANAANVGTYSADCIALVGKNELYYAGAGDTVTLNLTNCANYAKSDQEDALVADGSTTASMTLDPGYSYEFWTNSNDGFSAEVGFIMPETVPSGQLLISQDIVMPASPKEFTLGAANSDGEHALNGNEDCLIETNDSHKQIYTTQRIKISVAGQYTFRNVGTNPIGGYMHGGSFHPFEDTFLALYSSFNPNSSDDNVVGCNDDLNDLFEYDNEMFYEDLAGDVTMEGHQPYFTATLTPGYYTLVLTTWSAVTASECEPVMSTATASPLARLLQSFRCGDRLAD
jgi:hypothetical protein